MLSQTSLVLGKSIVERGKEGVRREEREFLGHFIYFLTIFLSRMVWEKVKKKFAGRVKIGIEGKFLRNHTHCNSR